MTNESVDLESVAFFMVVMMGYEAGKIRRDEACQLLDTDADGLAKTMAKLKETAVGVRRQVLALRAGKN